MFFTYRIPALFGGSEVEITFTEGMKDLPSGTVKAARKKHNLTIMVQWSWLYLVITYSYSYTWNDSLSCYNK